MMGDMGPRPRRMTPALLQKIMTLCASANSVLAVFQLQDVLDLDESLWRPDPKADRINVPGTLSDLNWTWRMPLAVEDLAGRTVLSRRLRDLVQARRGPRSGS
jgi:4-alpha-glucanotransferase